MKKVKLAIFGLLGIFGSLAFWGVAIEPYLIDTQEEVAEIPRLPAAWEGQRVALIADWQVGMWLGNTPTIRRVVAQLIKERPASVFIAGDFVYQADGNPTKYINQVIELVRPLVDAGIPTYAVLGNHDYSMDAQKLATKNKQLAEKVRKSLEAVGVRVLQNEAVALTPPADGNQTAGGKDEKNLLYIAGIGAEWPNEDDPLTTINKVPKGAARLVLMHNPDSFEALPAGTAPLAMAGHTHGGQMRLPFLPDSSWMTFVKEDTVHTDGWIEDYGQPNNRLYVNRGIGFSIVPVRINCPPEVTLFTLQSAG